MMPCHCGLAIVLKGFFTLRKEPANGKRNFQRRKRL